MVKCKRCEKMVNFVWDGEGLLTGQCLVCLTRGWVILDRIKDGTRLVENDKPKKPEAREA